MHFWNYYSSYKFQLIRSDKETFGHETYIAYSNARVHENSPLLVYQHSNMTTIYFSIFGLIFLYSSLLWGLRDNGVVKNLQF